MENNKLHLKSALQNYIAISNTPQNCLVSLEIKNNLEKDFIDHSLLNFIYDNNILYYKFLGFYVNDILFYDNLNKITYLLLKTVLINNEEYHRIISTIKNIISDTDNNILHVTFNKHNIGSMVNKIIRFIKKYFSIIYIDNLSEYDYDISSKCNNSFIYYRKLKFELIDNLPIKCNHKDYYISPSMFKICYKINVYNRLLYTFILLIIK